MQLDREACYRALTARDPRFDGVFFTAVSSTRIYCRPVCTARTPRLTSCTFYQSGAAAEKAGYRACLRCRPELAPGHAPVDAVSDLVRRAVARIDAGALNERTVESLAGSLGVTDRHLRRAMESELGVTPVELAQSRRIALAKQLLHDSDLSVAQIAFASGFASLRRFNALFLARFGQPPSAVRRALNASRGAGVVLVLDYRPPFDWDALLAFLAGRAIPGVERVVAGAYERTIRLGASVGRIAVARHPRRHALSVRVSSGLEGSLMPLAARLRALFDLDAAPLAVSAHLGRDPLLSDHVRARPGLRLPGAFDPFEMAVRALLGQQVSVRAATTLAGRLVRALGEPFGEDWLFPAPARIAAESGASLAQIGLPLARAESLRALATACATGALDLHATPPRALVTQLVELPGIGPWSAEYIAMRARSDPDAFPAADLGLRKALGGLSPGRAIARARAWSPWRSYAVMHLWTGLSERIEP